MKSKIQEKLHQLAMKRSIPFCYNDYIECPTGVCPKCGSDDLMRMLPEVGCEYGTYWIVKHIIEKVVVSIDQIFEESMRQCYPEETTVGWMKFDTVDLMKSQDPISWRIARDEYIDSLAEDEQIISFDNGTIYYWIHDLNSIIE